MKENARRRTGKTRRKERIVYRNVASLELMMVSRVGLALCVAVIVVPLGTGRPSTPVGNGCGPSTTGCTAVPSVVRGDIVGVLGPEGLETNEGRDGERDKGSKDSLLGDDTDSEVSQSGQGADLHFRRHQEGQE